MYFLILVLVLMPSAFGEELASGMILSKSKAATLEFVQKDGHEQMLVSKSLKTGKQLKRVTIWKKDSEGSLLTVEPDNGRKSDKVEALFFYGQVGDSNVYVIAVWNPKTGDIAELIRLKHGSDIETDVRLTNETELTIDIKPNRDFSTLEINTKITHDECAARSIKMKTESPYPKSYTFDVKDLADIRISCKR